MSGRRFPLARMPFPRVKGTKAQAAALDHAIRSLPLTAFPRTVTRRGERRVSPEAQRAVLTVVADHANGAGFSFLTVATIVHESGWHKRTVQRALVALASEKLVERYPYMRSPDRYPTALPRRARQGQGPSIYRVARVLRTAAGLAEVEWPLASDSPRRTLERDRVTPGEASSCHPRDATADEPRRVMPGSDPVSPPNERDFPASADFPRGTPRTKNGIASDNRGVPTTGSDRTFGLDDREKVLPWHHLAQLASERNDPTRGLPPGYSWLTAHPGDEPDENTLLADAEHLVDLGLATWEES